MKKGKQKDTHLKKVISKSQALAFLNRWKIVNEAERSELRQTSVEHKFKQLASLMASVEALGWTAALKSEENKARSLWIKLKNKYRG